jgi:glycosyltransferase involved in cell wall biosynthesis
MKILFFAESLTSGGKERRILELISYLTHHTEHEVTLVLTEHEIYYTAVYDLGITIKVFKRRFLKYDPRLFISFLNYCRDFSPDIIHTWGKMTTFYAIPAKIFCKVPMVSNLIADTNKRFKPLSIDSFFFKAGIYYSSVILSNSKAGLLAYNIKTPKASVIYNGVNLKRFEPQFDIQKEKEALGIKTPYAIVMVAIFSALKDYDLFVDVAKKMREMRDDVTFIAVGNGFDYHRIQQRIKDEGVKNFLLPGYKNNVESIIAACDIGLLCTFSEGISNSIIEYMGLGKPVITTDLIGGSSEIVVDGETGFIIDRNADEIIISLNLLLDNKELRDSMGAKGKQVIENKFSIDRMGKEFENIYNELVLDKE